jgi:hypothetical protein
LRRLAERERKFDRANPHLGKDKKDYDQWYSVPVAARAPWKLGWWWEEAETAKSVKQFVKTKYNKPDVSDFINVAEGQTQEGDWLLCFYWSKGKPSRLGWMFVDHVIPVARSDKGVYEKDYPDQAVQVFSSTHYPSPPFTLRDVPIIVEIEEAALLASSL